jgi:hypothetical protein
MSNFTRLLTGAAAATAGIAGIAAPAVAQTAYPYSYPQTAYPQPAYPQPGYAYPQTAYPQQGYAYPQQGYAYPQQGYAYPQQGYGYPQQYGYQNQGTIGSIIGQLLGNRYNVTDRTAVTQCASAAQAQAAAQYRPGYAYGYGNGYSNQGYNQYNQYNQYSHGNGTTRVTAITDVHRSSYGLRVSGLMNSGMAGYAYGNQRYNSAYNTVSDLSFRCDVDYRGAVTNLRVDRIRR